MKVDAYKVVLIMATSLVAARWFVEWRVTGELMGPWFVAAGGWLVAFGNYCHKKGGD
jgi:hypothetical protein